MANTTKSTVDTPVAAYIEMQKHWALIDDLLGGTLAMREAGKKWLPQEPKESTESYNARLNRSILYGAYSDAVDDLAGRPFSKPVTVHEQEKLPEQLQDIIDNCDKQGTDITQFAKELFTTLLNRGVTHILPDQPRIERQEGEKLTLADEQRLKIRPYFIHIKPDQLIGWRSVVGNDGRPVLTQIRWKTTRVEPDGDYGEKIVNEIRVMTQTTWEVHTQNEKSKKYELTESGTHDYPDGIPLVTIYVNKTGFMTGLPPMEGLAWMNLAHWQSYSDQRHILRFARCALLFASGLSEEEMDKSVELGPTRMFKCQSPDADMKYVEHSGASIDAGRQDIMDIEERMTVLGLEPLLSRPGNQTATGQSIDEAKSQSSVQSWIRAVEMGLDNCFAVAAIWQNVELPEKFSADIYNDFGLSVRAATDIVNLIAIRQAREIDRETFLREIKRRALLADTTEIDDVIAKVETEGPDLGSIGREEEAEKEAFVNQ